MTKRQMHQIRVGDFCFEPDSCALTKNGVEIRVEPQVAQLLGLFVEAYLRGDNKGILSKDSITKLLWPNRIVSDDALRATVKKLREALGDNAKSPKYIKTLPLTGYQLICELNELTHSAVSHDIRSKRKKLSVLLAACAISLLALSGFYFFDSSSPVLITKLTEISGSELRPSYHNHSQRILFSHRENKDDFLQIYVKDLNEQKVTRLTWDEANYANMKWAPDGKHFVYTRSTLEGMQHYKSRFDPKLGMTDIQELGAEHLNNFYLLAWSHTQNAVYLTDVFTPGSPQGIWEYNLDTRALKSITTPNVPGRGDHFAKESHDGKMLAVLRTHSLNKHELFVLHLSTGEVVYSEIFKERMDRLVWSQSNHNITLGNFDGRLFVVDLKEKTMADKTPNIEFTNHLFFQCGEGCYFMRQHTGNYLDIAEQPNPFSSRSSTITGNFELAGANDFPIYAHTSQRLYFVSQYGASTKIEYFDEQYKANTIKAFPVGSQIQSLALNSDDNVFVGLLNSRLFTYQIASDTFTWLSNPNDIIYPPHWHDESNFRYAKLEKNQVMLYQYSMHDNTTTFIRSGDVFLAQLAPERYLSIDKSYNVSLSEGGEARRIATLPSSQSNRFKIVGNTLFYTDRIENSQYLFALSLEDGTLEKAFLAKNRFIANFDFSTDRNKLAVVKSLLAQSDLVKVQLNN